MSAGENWIHAEHYRRAVHHTGPQHLGNGHIPAGHIPIVGKHHQRPSLNPQTAREETEWDPELSSALHTHHHCGRGAEHWT